MDIGREAKYWGIVSLGILITIITVDALESFFGVTRPPSWLLATVWVAGGATHQIAAVLKWHQLN